MAGHGSTRAHQPYSLALEHLGQNPAHHLSALFMGDSRCVSVEEERGGEVLCHLHRESPVFEYLSESVNYYSPLGFSSHDERVAERGASLYTNVRSRGMAWRLFSTCTSCQAATRAASRAASASSRARLRLRIASYIFFTSSGDAIFFLLVKVLLKQVHLGGCAIVSCC